jgi:hypothetical protein
MPRLASTLAPLALFAALATACGATSTESLGKTADPIINGVPSTADQDYAIGLALLDTNGQYMGGCSGSLIAENLVLTARHCVSQVAAEGLACTSAGKPVGGTGGVNADYLPKQLAVLIGPTLATSGGGFNPKFAAKGQKIFHTAVNNLCNNDIALILLDTKIVGAKLAQLRLDTPPVAGELMTAIGWGVANNTSSQIPSRRTRADIPVLKVGPANLGASGGLGPNEFEIAEGICSGDSGGPAVAQSTGAVIGVVSRGGNGDPAADPNNPVSSCVNTTAADGTKYTASNFYTRVDGFKDLIATAFQEAGADPWLEGQPDPRKAKFGEPCDGPDACQSALCIEVGAGTQCSTLCDAATPCPTDYSCMSAGAQSVCAPTAAPAPATTSSGGCAVASTGLDAGRASLALTIGLAGLALAVASRRRR